MGGFRIFDLETPWGVSGWTTLLVQMVYNASEKLKLNRNLV